MIFIYFWQRPPPPPPSKIIILRDKHKTWENIKWDFYFAKSPIFAKYIGHRGLFVCLSAMYRLHRWSDRPEILTDDVFCTKDYGQFFFWKSDIGQGQGHHFCENHIMGHNFWTGSGRDFWLVAERSL